MVMKRSKSEITSERPIVTGKAEASAVAGLSKPLIASPAEKSSSRKRNASLPYCAANKLLAKF